MFILGVKVDNLSMDETLEKADYFMSGKKQRYIVTPNPEFLIEAQKDPEFKEIINNSDLSVPDGIGLIFASWFLGKPLKERITGIDLMNKICKEAVQKNWKIGLVGSEPVPKASQETASVLKKNYPGLRIGVLETDQNCKPKKNEAYSVLFVALGAPKQEKWIKENLKNLPSVKLFIGIGGAFDFISGRIKRAPKILRATGMEWIWRLIVQPWRIRRIFNAVVKFPFLIMKSRLSTE